MGAFCWDHQKSWRRKLTAHSYAAVFFTLTNRRRRVSGTKLNSNNSMHLLLQCRPISRSPPTLPSTWEIDAQMTRNSLQEGELQSPHQVLNTLRSLSALPNHIFTSQVLLRLSSAPHLFEHSCLFAGGLGNESLVPPSAFLFAP